MVIRSAITQAQSQVLFSFYYSIAQHEFFRFLRAPSDTLGLYPLSPCISLLVVSFDHLLDPPSSRSTSTWQVLGRIFSHTRLKFLDPKGTVQDVGSSQEDISHRLCLLRHPILHPGGEQQSRPDRMEHEHRPGA